MNTVQVTLNRLNEMAKTGDDAPIQHKLELYREEQLLVRYLENAGRPAIYDFSTKTYRLKSQERCATCGREPFICLLDLGLALCKDCCSLLASIQVANAS